MKNQTITHSDFINLTLPYTLFFYEDVNPIPILLSQDAQHVYVIGNTSVCI